MSELLVRTAADGRLVGMVDLRVGGSAEDAIAEAEARGAVELWAYGDELAAHGFEPADGYVRLRAELLPPGEPIDETADLDRIVALLDRCYVGLWGHWRPDRDAVARAVGRPDLHHLVLADDGLCRVDVADRAIDAPGVVPDARSPEQYAQLVLGACALLGPGPATIESWGDPSATIAAYEALGFRIEDRLQGWRRSLRPPSVSR